MACSAGSTGRADWFTASGDWRSPQDAADVEARLAEVERIAATEVPSGVPLGRWALAWCLQHPAVSAVIPGSKTIEQLEGNVAAATLDLVSPAHSLTVTH